MKTKIAVIVFLLASQTCFGAEVKGRITMLDTKAGVIQVYHNNVVSQYKATPGQLKGFKVGGDWIKIVEEDGVVKSLKESDFN